MRQRGGAFKGEIEERAGWERQTEGGTRTDAKDTLQESYRGEVDGRRRNTVWIQPLDPLAGE